MGGDCSIRALPREHGVRTVFAIRDGWTCSVVKLDIEVSSNGGVPASNIPDGCVHK